MESLSIKEAANLRKGQWTHNLDDVLKFLEGMEKNKEILGIMHSLGYTRTLLKVVRKEARLTVSA